MKACGTSQKTESALRVSGDAVSAGSRGAVGRIAGVVERAASGRVCHYRRAGRALF